MLIPLIFIQSVSALTIALGSALFLLLFWQSAGPGARRSLGTLTTVFALMVVARLADLLPSLRWIAAIADLFTGVLLLRRAWALWPDRHNLSQSFALLRRGLGPTEIADAAGRFDALFSNAGLGIALRDAVSGQVLECNARYLEIVGRRHQSLLRGGGTDWTKSEFVPQETDLRGDLVNRVIPSYELTKQILLPDGSDRWVRVWATLANAGSKTMDVLADVDLEMRASVDRDQYLARLELLNRELEGFAYACAHDLKSPLRRIRQRLQLALGMQGDEQVHKIREAIGMGDRLSDFIEQLLEYGRLDRDSDMTLMGVSVTAIAESIAYQFEGEATFKIDQQLPKIRCNPVQLERLFANLYGNSVKHGGPGTEITVSFAGKSGKSAVIEVSDNGPGIDGALADSLFQLFVRGENSTGAGLGLAICQKIAVAHGGKIALAPTENGACFRIHLPLV